MRSRATAWRSFSYLLAGAGLGDVVPEIRMLLLFTVVLVPVGLAAFALALRRARVEGSLVQY